MILNGHLSNSQNSSDPPFFIITDWSSAPSLWSEHYINISDEPGLVTIRKQILNEAINDTTDR